VEVAEESLLNTSVSCSSYPSSKKFVFLGKSAAPQKAYHSARRDGPNPRTEH